MFYSIIQQHLQKTAFLDTSIPELMHIELTTKCPLHCPQCYCDLTSGANIDKTTLFSFLDEAAHLKIHAIALSGGEPLVYPHLIETIQHIHGLGMYACMATSGSGLTPGYLEKLTQAGLNELYVSLNGSTDKIHGLSRDGYKEGIVMLEMLQGSSITYGINWVARKDNAADFPNMVRLARKYGAKKIAVLFLKPDSNHESTNGLTPDLFYKLAQYLKDFNDPDLMIYVEACYTQLCAYLGATHNHNITGGCSAGRSLLSLDVDGNLRPCRHLEHPEKYSSIKAYWDHSKVLKDLQSVEDNIKEPCNHCSYLKECLPCRASCEKLYGDFFAGDSQCPIYHSNQSENKLKNM